MRRAAWLAFALVFSSGCLVLSLQPAYDDASIAFNDALLGRWANADDQTQLAIERGEWRSYKITYTERGAPRVLNGNLTRIGAADFMDVTEMRGADPGPYLIPVHGVLKIALEGDMLSAAPLDFEWFTRAVAEKRRGLPPLAIDDRRNVIFATPSAQLRQWLARAPAAAFGTPMPFTRQP